MDILFGYCVFFNFSRFLIQAQTLDDLVRDNILFIALENFFYTDCFGLSRYLHGVSLFVCDQYFFSPFVHCI